MCAWISLFNRLYMWVFTALTSQFRSQYNGFSYESSRDGNKKKKFVSRKIKMRATNSEKSNDTYIVCARIQIALLLIDTPLFGHLYVLQSFQNSYTYNTIIAVSSDVNSALFMAPAIECFFFALSLINLKRIADKLLNV